MSDTMTHNLLKLTVWPSGTCQRRIVLGIGGETLGDACGTAPFLSSLLLLNAQLPLPQILELAALAAALSLCEIANEKEWKAITG